ncbi:predicted protein [Sclerotinia sclerotiorum 1980 UF-70]|uniref:Uncharacterized protein n=1 Tax=Sclerotinia sclerotiorum (strain ATCC 18683 / 1980 / Ss-1) TaxID=665079 RepID=A7F3U2_SCLS1|nr:predicted protein [Sclerotinia sclerotiorum 1980 UF-70]EDN97413.1 predicted protein [Sclerotinia sclerotiorum 1980 UF-70]
MSSGYIQRYLEELVAQRAREPVKLQAQKDSLDNLPVRSNRVLMTEVNNDDKAQSSNFNHEMVTALEVTVFKGS